LKKIVLPGEKIGAAEEYLPGYGTKEESGMIYATMVGEVLTDPKNMIISVIPANPIGELKVGDLVYGVITDLMRDFVIVQVIVNGDFESIAGGVQTGTIHISKISKVYVDKSDEEFKVGDIVRAKVIKVKPSLQLTTNEDDLGVIKAYCGRCKKALIRENDLLVCTRCKRKEKRKIAKDYGMVEFKYKN